MSKAIKSQIGTLPPSTRICVKLECRARAKCIYKIQREAIATTRNTLKLLASHCFGQRRDKQLRTSGTSGCVLGTAWLVTLFPSFTLSFLVGILPFRARQRVLSLSLSASSTAVRALTCHWPCPLASAARSLVCLLGHLSVVLSLSLSAHRSSLLLFLVFFLSIPSSDSRVYSRALTVVSWPSTDTCLIFLGQRFSRGLHPRSEQGKLKRNSHISEIFGFTRKKCLGKLYDGYIVATLRCLSRAFSTSMFS